MSFVITVQLLDAQCRVLGHPTSMDFSELTGGIGGGLMQDLLAHVRSLHGRRDIEALLLCEKDELWRLYPWDTIVSVLKPGDKVMPGLARG